MALGIRRLLAWAALLAGFLIVAFVSAVVFVFKIIANIPLI